MQLNKVDVQYIQNTNLFDRCIDQDCKPCVSERPYIHLCQSHYRRIHPGPHTQHLMLMNTTSSPSDRDLSITTVTEEPERLRRLSEEVFHQNNLIGTEGEYSVHSRGIQAPVTLINLNSCFSFLSFNSVFMVLFNGERVLNDMVTYH